MCENPRYSTLDRYGVTQSCSLINGYTISDTQWRGTNGTIAAHATFKCRTLWDQLYAFNRHQRRFNLVTPSERFPRLQHLLGHS